MNNPHGYTWRERLADWISGGALTRHFMAAEFAGDLSNKRKDRWREAHQIACQWREHAVMADEQLAHVENLSRKAHKALAAIHAATKDGKSGTARKVARMAEEALK